MKEKDILKFWRDVEIFDLPDFKKDAILVDINAPLPWNGKMKEPKEYHKWSYTLVFGKIEKKYIIDYLNTLLKAELKDNDWEETIKGFSCLSALTLDEQGRPQNDSYVLSSYILGINALRAQQNISSVSVELQKVREDFLERYNIFQNNEDDNIPNKCEIINFNHLNKEIEYLERITPWIKKDIKVFLLVEEVPKDSEPNPSFMNSFYLNDLNYLSDQKRNKLGIALQQYLQLEPKIDERKDLIKNKQSLFDAINPSEMTAGRWPSKIEYGLYTAQLGAVNTIFSNLRNQEGIQGVNGPPGTGKTTLLLDVIAEIIVGRAKVISKLGCDGIFQKRGGYKKIEKESGFNLHTYNLDNSLQNNFGIVVTSNNNAAVENISKELPLKSKIDADNFPNAEYFSECSSKLIDDESWGALAAALGNSKNRSNFSKAFWQSKDQEVDVIGFEDLLYEVYKDQENDYTDIHYQSFDDLNIRFKDLLKDFETFKMKATSFHNELPKFIKNKKLVESVKSELLNINNDLLKLEEEKQFLQEKESNTKNEVDSLQTLSNLHIQQKPSFFFFQKIFNTTTFKKWNSESTVIMNNLSNLLTELEELKKNIIVNTNESQLLIKKKDEQKITLSELDSFFKDYKNIESELSKTYGISVLNLLNIDFYNKNISEIHLLNPYHSLKIAKLRSDIFLTALQLHRSAILANAKKFRNNLKAYFEMNAGWIKIDPITAQNLWDIFFFCVPVVSTTLASVSRLFPNINKNQIGWLLIDEAGQATPQSAAGIIHRSKRCVIVGDPLQVEPVVTIPKKLVAKLRSEHNVSVEWSPYKTSVQKLSDRISLKGTYMNVGSTEEKIWTGFPLRTHRRCDEPMFSIANKIAYSDQMVKAINKNSEEQFIGSSTWFNVNSDTGIIINKHVIKEEIILLTEKINDLRNKKYEGDIYIISPFKSVASYCNTVFKYDKKISCGTIHRFQGKEADIVFLVLGSNPKSSKAREWASNKPNMLNVALTRAKKRFYVIGSEKNWAPCNYYSTMFHTLS